MAAHNHTQSHSAVHWHAITTESVLPDGAVYEVTAYSHNQSHNHTYTHDHDDEASLHSSSGNEWYGPDAWGLVLSNIHVHQGISTPREHAHDAPAVDNENPHTHQWIHSHQHSHNMSRIDSEGNQEVYFIAEHNHNHTHPTTHSHRHNFDNHSHNESHPVTGAAHSPHDYIVGPHTHA